MNILKEKERKKKNLSKKNAIYNQINVFQITS